MNNEEAIEQLKFLISGESNQYPPDYDLPIRIAINALERADKYRRHDLRKNPDDLPLANETAAAAFTVVLVEMRQKFYEVAFYYKEWNGYTGFHINGLPAKDIIAWREIEPSEEEEDAEI